MSGSKRTDWVAETEPALATRVDALEKSSDSGAVDSVNGQTGDVVLDVPTADQKAALDAANSPSATNEILTRDDVFTGPSLTLAEVLAAGNDAEGTSILNANLPIAVVTGTTVTYADTTLNSTALVGGFYAAWVGWLASGPGIATGTTLASVSGTPVDGIYPNADLSQNATATATVPLRLTEPDPGSIGANQLWLRRDPDGALIDTASLSLRKSTDDGWLALGPNYYTADGAIGAAVTVGGGGGPPTSMVLNVFDDSGNVAVAFGLVHDNTIEFVIYPPGGGSEACDLFLNADGSASLKITGPLTITGLPTSPGDPGTLWTDPAADGAIKVAHA